VTTEEILAVSEERDQHECRLQQAERTAYQRGYADGDRDGYERGARLLNDNPVRVDPLSPSLADLELQRWGPGGRSSFGDPRSTDRIRPQREGVA
jgi:hypothetical protein